MPRMATGAPNLCRIGIARSPRRTLPSRGCGASSCCAALVAATAAHAGTAPSEAEYHKLCRAIHPAHVRALFTAPVAPIQLGGTSDCAFFPRGGNALVNGVRVFLRIDDGDKTLWLHKRRPSVRRVPVARGDRRACEVGLPVRQAPVGRRRPPRHLHMHGDPDRRRHEVHAVPGNGARGRATLCAEAAPTLRRRLRRATR